MATPHAPSSRAKPLALLAATAALALDDFIRTVGSAPWPPQHRYLARIPLAKEVIDFWH